jgi:2'-5' RNA ligase
VNITPVPHFSWQIAEEYNIPLVEEILAHICRKARPFQVATTGLGLFTGLSPIIYIPLVKDAVMMTFHKVLWERLAPARSREIQHYAPSCWVPHITLAYGDVTEPGLLCAVRKLAFEAYNWEILVDNLSFAYQPAGAKTWTEFKFRFGG